MMKKNLITAVISVGLIAAISVGATLAYMSQSVQVTNTFAVGDVEIDVEEPSWPGATPENPDKPNPPLIPGDPIPKDPTVIVKANSEECYVRVRITIDPELEAVIDIPEANVGWTRTSGAVAGEYLYIWPTPVTKDATDQKIGPAFLEVVPKVDETNETLTPANGKNIVVYGEAIQAAGFDTMEAAWAAFSAKAPTNP